MGKWKEDLRAGILILLGLTLTTLSALALVWFAASGGEGEQVAVMAEADRPCVAITFDDGPRRETTTRLLDGLARRGIHATFFIVGTRVEGREDILLRMDAEGHQIGIHSQTHRVLTGLGEGELRQEIEPLCAALDALLGRRTYMLRPPYGLTDPALLSRVDEAVILWSVDPEDWSDHDTARQVAAVVEQVEDGDIILLHDIYHASVDTALQVTDQLLERGYRLVTVEELFALRGITPEAGREYRSLPPAA